MINIFFSKVAVTLNQLGGGKAEQPIFPSGLGSFGLGGFEYQSSADDWR